MKNKNVDIYFFTGTGNTYLAAKKISEVLTQHEHKVRLANIENTKPENIDLSKTIGLGFAIACWNTYPFVRRFIKSLPSGNGAEVFVFTTMGNSSLKAAQTVADILKNKGYVPIAAQGFKMPNNWLGVQSEEKNAAKKEKALRKIENFALDIAHSSAYAQKTNLFFNFCFLATSAITSLWETKFWQNIIRFKTDKTKCTKCGLCAKICSVGQITIAGGYPVFNKNKCQLCLRCFSYCPARALNSLVTGKKVYKALNNKEVSECFLLK
ncbi:EFR1 family ferrodoxin [Endomicrobium proavitum]|uniref:Ferredoxin n=1 Tax=Endomicrobium proavitum TaxID=1408281 RepID=A0A0G3WI39_9BACT|nr:EFR1 family ferrodoxin [Endomicrobium proavitum]AKL97550.1 ferredoxin [Endomicrobium proavitum]